MATSNALGWTRKLLTERETLNQTQHIPGSQDAGVNGNRALVLPSKDGLLQFKGKNFYEGLNIPTIISLSQN